MSIAECRALRFIKSKTGSKWVTAKILIPLLYLSKSSVPFPIGHRETAENSLLQVHGKDISACSTKILNFFSSKFRVQGSKLGYILLSRCRYSISFPP